MPRGAPSPLPCVVIITHKERPHPFEAISLTQCYHLLGSYDTFLVYPESVDPRSFLQIHPGLKMSPVKDVRLSSYAEFNRLKLDACFYRRFIDYTHILFYELDSFVFSDTLHNWCDRQIYYLGAPWLSSESGRPEFEGVGNGGFSLRHIPTLLRILDSHRRLYTRKELFALRHRQSTFSRIFSRPATFLEYCFNNTVRTQAPQFQGPEDFFWGKYIPRSFNDLRRATVQEATEFAFERKPEQLFRATRGRLPFGCHAWWTYDLSFWRPFIEAFGHDLAGAPPANSQSARVDL